jgi:hypothetical protein
MRRKDIVRLATVIGCLLTGGAGFAPHAFSPTPADLLSGQEAVEWMRTANVF